MAEAGGALENFKIDAFITTINELVRSDEVERALWVCDNLPAYYRDNKPKEIVEIKRDILQRLATPRFYAHGEYDCRFVPDNNYHMTLRGHLILEEVKALNAKEIIPHIIDFGPGEFTLPLMLKKHECKFTYDGLGLNEKAAKVVEPHLDKYLSKDTKDKTVIYVATEIIEHLWNENDVKVEMLRTCGLAKIVHISTPRYTFDTRDVEWRVKDLGHLRAYTPLEFREKVAQMFCEYDGAYYSDTILHARLTLRD